MKRSRDGLYWRGKVLAFRYQDKNGDWQEKYTGKHSREEAKAFKRDFLENLHHGTLPTNKAKWTVTKACTLWVDDHAAHLRSTKARANERSYLRQLTRRLGSKKLEDIRLDDVKQYQRERRKQVRERPINLELQILINVLKEANLWFPIAQHYKRLKEPESTIGQALNGKQLQILEQTAAKKDSWQVAYCASVLAANTGLRGGEIKQLRIGAIDLERRRVCVSRDITKTDAGVRIVELNQAATWAVWKLHGRAQLLGATDSDHYLLPADLSRHTKNTDPLKGGRGFDVSRHQISWGSAWRSLRLAAAHAIIEKANEERREPTTEELESNKKLRRIRFHDLRHTFITLMAEAGVPLLVVQAMVGHMSAAMVRYYTHISNRAARNAVELLDGDTSRLYVGNYVGEPTAVNNPNAKPLN